MASYSIRLWVLSLLCVNTRIWQAIMYLCNCNVTLTHVDQTCPSDTDHRTLGRTPHKESHSLGISINPSLNVELILVTVAFCDWLQYNMTNIWTPLANIWNCQLDIKCQGLKGVWPLVVFLSLLQANAQQSTKTTFFHSLFRHPNTWSHSVQASGGIIKHTKNVRGCRC